MSRVSLQEFDISYIMFSVNHIKCMSVVSGFSPLGGWGESLLPTAKNLLIPPSAKIPLSRLPLPNFYSPPPPKVNSLPLNNNFYVIIQ